MARDTPAGRMHDPTWGVMTKLIKLTFVPDINFLMI